MPDKVSISACPDYQQDNVDQSVKQIFDHFGGIRKFVSPGQRVLLKPNMICPDPPEKLSTTHPAVVAAVTKLVREAGGIPFIGDIPVIGSARRVAKASGILAACQHLGAEIVELGTYCPSNNHQDPHYGQLGSARQVFQADVIINLPKLKAHEQILLTLGVKNMFGGVSLPRRVWRHIQAGDGALEFSRMVLSTYLMVPPAFTLIDGIIAMETKGPRGGTAKPLGILAGGCNAVAVDRVIVEALSLPWRELPVLAIAQEMGVSGWDFEQIELCGTPLEQVQVSDFKFPRLVPVQFAIWRSLKIVARQTWKKLAASKSNSAPRQPSPE
ncbi:MAG: DUF362 domain-containing protein [Candidatus Schekmanbacteria bacterium]|nr:DUF362 domain-containing protein [Candidatus Schekmanbacteria bacterium]